MARREDAQGSRSGGERGAPGSYGAVERNACSNRTCISLYIHRTDVRCMFVYGVRGAGRVRTSIIREAASARRSSKDFALRRAESAAT